MAQVNLPVKINDQTIGSVTIYDDGRVLMNLSPNPVWKEIMQLINRKLVSHISIKPIPKES